jgi:RNA polymerase sigma-70 factor, ECF subfamily
LDEFRGSWRVVSIPIHAVRENHDIAFLKVFSCREHPIAVVPETLFLASTMPDKELLSRCRGGDLQALSQLYFRHAAGLHFYVQSLTRDRDRADDILQDVFLRLLEIDPASIRTSVKAYLYVVARNEVFQAARRDSRASHVPILSEPSRPEAIVDAERAEIVSKALDALPSEQREVVVLKTYGGHTLSEIADVTGTSLGTATSRYRYALEKLSSLLRKVDP